MTESEAIMIIELPTLCDAYKATIHHVDENNVTTHLFNYWDHVDQDDFMTKQYNKRNKQGVLFL